MEKNQKQTRDKSRMLYKMIYILELVDLKESNSYYKLWIARNGLNLFTK